jgi:hypothetical protein
MLHGSSLDSVVVAVGLDTARQEWAEAAGRVEAARAQQPRYDRLLAQVDVVAGELRRRVGQTFTLDELARAYGAAESWASEVVSEQAGTPGWARDLATVTAAAFHAYRRGALDYEP